jgi:single-strand DNA-binding protein
MTAGGQAVCKLRLATNKRFKANDGQWKEATEWHRVVVWGPRGENISRHLSKGSTVLVRGELRTNSYEDRDGNKRYTTEVYADEVIFGGRQRDEFDQRPATEDTSPATGFVPAGVYGPVNPDDDIPF